MIAIFRWISRLVKNEHILRARYHRSHPHFLWYLSLDAVISIILIVGGMHFFLPMSWTTHERFAINHPGVIPMPVDKFLDIVSRESEGMYWLGPVKADKYTIDLTKDEGFVITYIPPGTNASNQFQRKFTITTYINRAIYLSEADALLDMNSKKISLPSGNTVEFSEASLDREIVNLKGRPTIVAISYPEAQTARTLIKNADALKLID
jgi:hypothetical protein